jgi:hypothetical protein
MTTTSGLPSLLKSPARMEWAPEGTGQKVKDLTVPSGLGMATIRLAVAGCPRKIPPLWNPAGTIANPTGVPLPRRSEKSTGWESGPWLVLQRRPPRRILECWSARRRAVKDNGDGLHERKRCERIIVPAGERSVRLALQAGDKRVVSQGHADPLQKTHVRTA